MSNKQELINQLQTIRVDLYLQALDDKRKKRNAQHTAFKELYLKAKTASLLQRVRLL